jgi:hypothetical protein
MSLKDLVRIYWEREHEASASTEAWLTHFTKTSSRQWPGLLAHCPFSVVRIKPIPFDIDHIGQVECAMWLAQQSTNGLDVSLIIESYTPDRSIYVSHMKYVLWNDPQIAGIICQDDAVAAMFKLTFPELLFTR